MPTVSGDDLREKVTPALRTEDVRSLTEAIKELTFGMVYSTNAGNLLTETLFKSRGVFSDFSSSVERSTIILQAFGRTISDVSQNLRGVTSSLEGFMSSLNILGTRTFPDVAKSISTAIRGFDVHIAKLKEQKEMLEGSASIHIGVIEGLKHHIDAMKKNKIEVDSTGVSLNDYTNKLKQHEDSLIKDRDAIYKTNEDLAEATVKAKSFGDTLSKGLGWITLIIGATMALAQAYDSSIKAKREVIYTLGRMGVSYATHIEAMNSFDKSFTGIASKWGMLREEMAKAVAPLAGLGVGVSAGGATTALKTGELQKTMTTAAEWTGAMMRGFGVEVGVTTRALGTISTAMNINGEALGDTFGRLATLGEKSVLGMQRYITETVSMLEITRKYGGAIEGVEMLTGAFGEGLKKGIYGMESLARLAAPAMWSPEQKGAVVALMQQYAPAEAGKLGVVGKDLFTGMLALERAAKDIKEGGDPKTLITGLDKVITKLVPTGASEGQRLYMMQQLLSQLTGVQISTLEAMNIFKDPNKLSKMLTPPKVETPGESMKNAVGTFKLTETFTERTAVGVEMMREGVMDIKTFMIDKWGEKTGVGTTGQLLAQMGRSGAVGAGAGAVIGTVAGPGGTAVGAGVGFVGGVAFEIAKALWDLIKLARGTKQTGGYISEEGEYYLHAGEQVRRPGEGTGGNISISLGGLNVSVGDRGDMNIQINEAFDRLKRDTIKEIEVQWEHSLHAH